MIKLYDSGAYILNGTDIIEDNDQVSQEIMFRTGRFISTEEASKGTIAYSIMMNHNVSENDIQLQLKFDSLTSHDITYVGIIQTAKASGIEKFPIPYVLTNCHNTLCAVGGTINEDDHKFALSAARKYGGLYVPPHLAVIHSYNREMMAGCGKMILGSDSHTRYGALGTMAVGEGGGELVKQLVDKTYDIKRPEVIAVYLTGKPRAGVGPQDVALQIIGHVFKNGYVKNKIMEFIGDGISNLPIEFRNGIDVMTTETTCWSSIWKTDDKVKQYFDIHKRPEDYHKLEPSEVAYYDGVIEVDLSKIKPSIALPFHPSNVYAIEEFQKNGPDILQQIQREAYHISNGKASLDLVSKWKDDGFYVDQGVIAGCAGGTFDNIVAAADILEGHSVGNQGFSLSVYPGSQPTYRMLMENGSIEKLMDAGVIIRSAFCGPCFGAGDTPAHNEFSIRHTTRNFPSREGSKPGEGQMAAVALMDARSIAATARNGGKLTAGDAFEVSYTTPSYVFHKEIYEKRNYDGRCQTEPSDNLVMGPGIKDWPDMEPLHEHLLLQIAAYIEDEVTTTDELIPSGETASFRSDPYRLAEFTLSRRDPAYTERAKNIQKINENFIEGSDSKLKDVWEKLNTLDLRLNKNTVSYGSTIYAKKPGDGSAREHAASCQKVLGAWANLANEYATKRYRSNLINWGIIPFIVDNPDAFGLNDIIFIPNVKELLKKGALSMEGYIVGEVLTPITLHLGAMTQDEREIIESGSLINYYRNQRD